MKVLVSKYLFENWWVNDVKLQWKMWVLNYDNESIYNILTPFWKCMNQWKSFMIEGCKNNFIWFRFKVKPCHCFNGNRFDIFQLSRDDNVNILNDNTQIHPTVGPNIDACDISNTPASMYHDIIHQPTHIFP